MIRITASKKDLDELINLIRRKNSGQSKKAWLKLNKIMQPTLSSIVSKYKSKGISEEKLISAGKVGIKKAIKFYDSSKKYKFSTYSTWWIRREIIREVLKSAHL